MILNLFENQIKEKRLPGFSVKEWQPILDHLWKNRYSFGLEDDSRYEFNRNSKQQFLKFTYDGLKSGKYAGVISTDAGVINIYPKIFKSQENIEKATEDSDKFSRYAFSHILWWMTYSDKIRLPKTFSSYDISNSNFLEVLIYLFAYYTEELLHSFSFNDYASVEDELTMVKGRIKFTEYIGNIGRGNFHKIPCEFDEFQHDNLLNRIILYVCNLLYPFTKEKRTKRLLDDILHHLDGVAKVSIVVSDCDKVRLNPLYEEYSVVLDYCRMFLSNSVVSSYSENISVFSFLINTEKLFEDFLYGLIKTHKSELGIKTINPQHRDSLAVVKNTSDKKFNVSIDYLITKENGEQIIADAKYKRIYRKETSDDKTSNYGISNADVFQMISYSARKGIKKISLIYPAYTLYKNNPISHDFEILDHDNKAAISLNASAFNVINHDISQFDNNTSINKLFQETETNLLQKLKSII